MENEIVGKVKEPTKLLRCGCAHAYQDKKYGKGLRVHNTRKTGDFKCTVCAKVNK